MNKELKYILCLTIGTITTLILMWLFFIAPRDWSREQKLFLILLFPLILSVFALLLGKGIGTNIIPWMMVGINVLIVVFCIFPSLIGFLKFSSHSIYLFNQLIFILLLPSLIYTFLVFLGLNLVKQTEKTQQIKKPNKIGIFSLILFITSMISMITLTASELVLFPISLFILSFFILILSEVIAFFKNMTKEGDMQQIDDSSKDIKEV